MKVVVFIRKDRFGFDALAARHPEHTFVHVEDADALAREIADAEVLMVAIGPYNKSLADMIKAKQKKLKWVQFSSSGIDAALHAGGFPAGTLVTNTAGLSAPMVAEHAIALMMMVGHRMRETEAATQTREWHGQIKTRMTALYRKTICIVGLGAIGQEAAKRARGLDMKIIGVSRAYQPDGLVDVVYGREDLETAFGDADVVLLSASASADTLNLINARSLGWLKPGAIVINVARGDMVDENALAVACENGHLAGAGLDVTKTEPLPKDSPLWTAPNIVITPHIAGYP